MRRTAADTNVLLRLLARDDPAQFERATKALLDGGLTVDSTVILEVEWVLRGVMRYDRQQINGILSALVALPGIIFTEGDRVVRAVTAHSTGMDFADALHLAGAAEYDEFVTFDRDLARRASAAADTFIPVRLL